MRHKGVEDRPGSGIQDDPLKGCGAAPELVHPRLRPAQCVGQRQGARVGALEYGCAAHLHVGGEAFGFIGDGVEWQP